VGLARLRGHVGAARGGGELSSEPTTLFEKVWRNHEVVPETPDTPAVLYIDLHLTHEVTTPQAFTVLRERGWQVRRPDLTLATMDHSTPTRTEQVFGGAPITIESAAQQIRQLEKNCAEFGIELLGLQHELRGIVHVIGPELGLTQPGKTIVCGDSHTSTHGAFGALAFGIGSTEVAHVFATQCLLQRKPRTLSVEANGALRAGVTAKDLILGIIGKLGVSGGTGHVIEYRGDTFRALDMDERMTVCNMSIEAGARAGMVAPDETTFAYLKGRPRSPQGEAWEHAVERWKGLRTDPGANFDKQLTIDANTLEPMITYGTNPGMVIPVTGAVPSRKGDPAFDKSLAYMGLEAGASIRDQKVNVVFVGSCTNSRLSDLRGAAQVLRGRKVARGVQMLVVPGSQQIKQAAEAEGLHKIFLEAGAQWRESGCSMCLGMNGDTVAAGEYSVSTSNRNFEGRQGAGARTLLASPLTAAASAVRGRVTDPRELLAT
jgi:3-isopropylmalate/(R)-2-methylmalate dehydratase large subunit